MWSVEPLRTALVRKICKNLPSRSKLANGYVAACDGDACVTTPPWHWRAMLATSLTALPGHHETFEERTHFQHLFWWNAGGCGPSVGLKLLMLTQALYRLA